MRLNAADNAIGDDKRVQEAQKNQAASQLMNSTVDSIKDIFNTLGEDNAEFVAFQKDWRLRLRHKVRRGDCGGDDDGDGGRLTVALRSSGSSGKCQGLHSRTCYR